MHIERRPVSPERRHPGAGRRRARGLSLISMLLVVIVVGFFAYVTIRVLPTVNEYLTIQRTIDKIAASTPPNPVDIRTAFERQKDIEYAITSITANDLKITKEGDRTVIAFAYEKEVPLGGPAYLLLKYQGRSK
jgi:hypothetical protein